MIVRQKFIFYGRVQGVGFRFRSRQFALNLGISGSVRNLNDGSVELEAEAEEALIHEFVDEICHSPFLKVTEMTSNEIPRTGETGFEILDAYEF